MKSSPVVFPALFVFAVIFPSSWVQAESAAPHTRTSIDYELDGVKFRSTVVHSPVGDSSKKRPGILMVPNWMGPTEAAIEKACKVAEDDFVVMVVDMYGVDVRPVNMDEAGKAAGVVRADRNMMRARAAKALAMFRGMADGGEVPLDADAVSAMGFCFGGGTVLELARSGADLDAVVSFHGDLVSPTLKDDAANTKAKVLVLHGAADPFVPQSDVREWVEVMNGTKVDWQIVQYGGTVHSFTDPAAAMTGKAEFNERSSKRAFEAMEKLLEEVYRDSD